MSSAIHNLQMAILDKGQSTTNLLRQAKLIAAKLNLEDVEKWVDLELKGYPPEIERPKYREVSTESVMLHNPYRGWVYAGDVCITIRLSWPLPQIEQASNRKTLFLPLEDNLPMTDSMGGSTGSDWPQRLTFGGAKLKYILEAVRTELLQWTVELEKRGIKGEDMNFDEKEKKSAANQVFNIGTVHGTVGNITHSQVSVYDYSSVHQLLIDHNIPKEGRHELEDIMDDLKTATPEIKHSLTKRGEDWIVKHKELLGARAEIVGKAIKAGMPTPPNP
jgi:hypothetical protein